MSVFQAIVLGAVQGLTEFLPISSSGHLAIGNYLFGKTLLGSNVPLAFDVLVHFASVVAIVAVLRRDVWSLLTTRRRLILPLCVGTVPAGFLGYFLHEYFETARSSMVLVGASLMFTGFVLALCERIGRRARKLDTLRLVDALAIGSAQALALVPGISRSGMTIGGGLLRGMTREACVRFSFLLAIPVIVGASVLEARGMIEMAHHGSTPALIAGAAASLAASVGAIKLLLGLIRRRSLALFAYYCVPVGMTAFVLSAPQVFAGWLEALGLGRTPALAGGYVVAIIVVAAAAYIVFVRLRTNKPRAQAAKTIDTSNL
jgi:undecaprenyl-diphosphatase